MLIAIVILSVLLFFAILFALAFFVHAKYTMSMFEIEAEYAQSLEKANESLRTNQKNLIENHVELMNRFNNLIQWTVNQGLYAKEVPPEEEDDDGPVQETFDFDDIDTDLIDKIVDEVVDNYQENTAAEE